MPSTPQRAQTLPPKFETVEWAELERQRLARMLRRSINPDAGALGELLEDCSEVERCGSTACPSCMRLLRIRWLHEGTAALKVCSRFFHVTLIPRGCRVEVGELGGFDFEGLIAREQRSLQRALRGGALRRKQCIILGGVDVSANTFENTDPHRQVHFHFVVGVSDGVTESEMRRVFVARGDPVLTRPVQLDVIHPRELANALTYVVKSRFARRSGYFGTRRNTRTFALTEAESVEFAVAFDRLTFAGRLLLVGIRRTWPSGRLRLTPLP